MFDNLQGHGCVTKNEARGMFWQLVYAIQYCSQRGIAHKDLTPENVPFDAHVNINVVDFRLSTQFTSNKFNTFCNTISYVAPELFASPKQDGPAVVPWSWGVILHEMITGTLPVMRKGFWELWKWILRRKCHVPFFLSLECKDILKKLMTRLPRDRGTLKQITRDPALNMGQEEKLGPYSEPPCGDMNACMAEEMANLLLE